MPCGNVMLIKLSVHCGATAVLTTEAKSFSSALASSLHFLHDFLCKDYVTRLQSVNDWR
jgi:hypothetical protein